MSEVCTYEDRVAELSRRLRELPGAIVAFSGGVDSSMLLHACRDALRDRVLAVTADSPSLPREELREAEEIARGIGADHKIIATYEQDRPEYRRNASDRCYFCKSELFERIAIDIRGQSDEDWPVLYGAIADDFADHRPGARAAIENDILAPLADCALTKADVRRYSRDHRLPTADKPSFACLASRVPYGTAVTPEVLARLERAEQVLRGLGYRQFRVRHHDAVARVELLVEDFQRAITIDREKIAQGVRAAGYSYVSLDLNGYRTGSMNEVLN
jgi:pyridinium-3,5-biscarboxylic acid mononucleotide sulfurtransferase